MLDLSGIAGVAGVSSLAVISDPEPVTKAVLPIIAAICFVLGSYFVYRLIKMLLAKEYKFKVKIKGINREEWIIEAEPA